MKFKIAYCISHFPYQSETYLLNQLKGLIEDNCEVTIFSTGQFEDYPKHAIVEQYGLLERTIYRPHIPQSRIKRFGTAIKLLFKNLSDAKHLLRTLNFFKYGKYALSLQFFYDTIPYLREKNFDIVHCQFGPNGIKALNFREIGLLKGAMITSLHGFDVNDKEFLSWPTHYSRTGLYRDLNTVCPLFTVSSNYTKQTAINLGIAPHKIKVLPVGLDTEKFKPAVDGKIKSFGSKPIVLTVARLVEFKGLKYSIQAIANLVPEFPNLQYHILGEGVKRTELEDQIKTTGLERHVFLHGAVTQEEALSFYRIAHVFVLTGIEATDGEVETQGLVVQEAQSMELPVVVSDVGGVPEGLLDGETGFVVPPKDVAAVAEKVRHLLRNHDLRHEMGKAGRKFVVDNFDNHVQHQKLMQLYRIVLGD